MLGVPVALRWRAPRLASLCGPGGQSAVRRGELKPLSQLGRGADGAAAPLPLSGGVVRLLSRVVGISLLPILVVRSSVRVRSVGMCVTLSTTQSPPGPRG